MPLLASTPRHVAHFTRYNLVLSVNAVHGASPIQYLNEHARESESHHMMTQQTLKLSLMRAIIVFHSQTNWISVRLFPFLSTHTCTRDKSRHSFSFQVWTQHAEHVRCAICAVEPPAPPLPPPSPPSSLLSSSSSTSSTPSSSPTIFLRLAIYTVRPLNRNKIRYITLNSSVITDWQDKAPSNASILFPSERMGRFGSVAIATATVVA